jgi:RHS repeat-associated protein
MLVQRLVPVGNATQIQNYNNDANGNTLSGNGRTMTWDSQNRMVSCVTGEGTLQKTSTFTYGTDGLRRSMVVTPNNGNPTTTTKYVLDGNSVVQEIVTTSNNSNPVIAATYLSGPSGPIYRRPTNSADVRWYVYDGTGNVVGEVDQLGNLTGSKKHDVYGATRSSSGNSTSRQGWQGGVGHQSDEETGLVYMRARYYAPEIGRFQSEDPKGDGNNWFVYCNNDPVNKSDPTGKENIPAGLTMMGAVGLILSIGGILKNLVDVAEKCAAFNMYLKAWAISIGLELIAGFIADTQGWGLGPKTAIVGVIAAMDTIAAGLQVKRASSMGEQIAGFWGGYALTMAVTFALLFADEVRLRTQW